MSRLGLFMSYLCDLQKQPPEVFYKKKSVLRNFAKFKGKHLCQSLFFNKVTGLSLQLLKKTLAQVFPCEFCEISKNTFLMKHLQATSSGSFFHFHLASHLLDFILIQPNAAYKSVAYIKNV